MRELSETIKAVLASQAIETYDIIELILPEVRRPPINGVAQSSLPEVKLYLAPASGIEINGQLYQPSLRGMEAIKFNLGRATDNAGVTIENLSKSFGFILTDNERNFEGAKAIIRRAFKTSIGWETDILFVGYIREVKLNEETIQLGLISDMSRRGTNVAKHQLSQRCRWVFRDKYCGWIPSQGGDPDICNYVYDSPLGCTGHNNTPRFGGVPQFTTLLKDGASNGYGNPPGGGGVFLDTGRWCVTPDTKILCIDDNGMFWKEAKDVTDQDEFVSIENGLPRRSKVLEAVKGLTSRLYTIQTESGLLLRTSPSHKVIQSAGDKTGKAVGQMKLGETILTYGINGEIAEESKLASIEVLDTECDVVTFKLNAPNTYVSNGIVSHNLKPLMPEPFSRGGWGESIRPEWQSI